MENYRAATMGASKPPIPRNTWPTGKTYVSLGKIKEVGAASCYIRVENIQPLSEEFKKTILTATRFASVNSLNDCDFLGRKGPHRACELEMLERESKRGAT